MRPLVDVLLTHDPRQRERLSQALLAMGLLATGVLAMHYFVAIGQADARGQFGVRQARVLLQCRQDGDVELVQGSPRRDIKHFP